eukprot:2258190-Pyramimonas_sp.AAC.1
MRRRSGLPRMWCCTCLFMLFPIVYFGAVAYVEALPNSLDPRDFALIDRLVDDSSGPPCDPDHLREARPTKFSRRWGPLMVAPLDIEVCGQKTIRKDKQRIGRSVGQ